MSVIRASGRKHKRTLIPGLILGRPSVFDYALNAAAWLLLTKRLVNLRGDGCRRLGAACRTLALSGAGLRWKIEGVEHD
jgi:hypothetical protein